MNQQHISQRAQEYFQEANGTLSKQECFELAQVYFLLMPEEQNELALAMQEDQEIEQFLQEYEAAIDDREPFFPEKSLFCFN